jgi:hypothetical protein
MFVGHASRITSLKMENVKIARVLALFVLMVYAKDVKIITISALLFVSSV